MHVEVSGGRWEVGIYHKSTCILWKVEHRAGGGGFWAAGRLGGPRVGHLVVRIKLQQPRWPSGCLLTSASTSNSKAFTVRIPVMPRHSSSAEY